MPVNRIGRKVVLLLRRGQGFNDVLNRHHDTPAAPTQIVDQLVPCDGPQPREDGASGIPTRSLQVNGQQSFLHNILGIGGAITLARKFVAYPTAQ